MSVVPHWLSAVCVNVALLVAGSDAYERLPKQQFGPRFVNDTIAMAATAQHAVYFCRFDAIAMHFLFETRHGRCRLFQAYVKDVAEIGAYGRVPTGFSAGEWVSRAPQASWSPALVAAHARYGGGREFDVEVLRGLLHMILQAQEAVCAIGPALVAQLPEAVRRGDEDWYSGILGACGGGPTEITHAPSAQWATRQLEDLGRCSTVSSRTGAVISLLCAGAPALALPLAPAQRLHEALLDFTGHAAQSFVVLRIIQNVCWWRLASEGIAPQLSGLGGWIISATTVAHD